MSLFNKLSPTITDMIRFDHSHVLLTYHQYKTATKPSVKKALGETLCAALEIHATLEEEIFYPVIRQLNGAERVIHQSQPQHDEMRRLIAELRITDPHEVRYDELVHDLMRDVMHHVADEETVLLPEAENMLSSGRLCELGAQMTHRRLALIGSGAGRMAVNTAIGFSGSTTARVMAVTGALLTAALIFRKSGGVRS